MEWYERLSKNNAELLTKKDTVELFNRLRDAYGGKKIAAERINVNRKTADNWEKGIVKDITTNNKEKVLSGFIRDNPINALEYLTEKSVNRSSLLLYELLTEINEEIMETTDEGRASFLLTRFFEDIDKFSKPITKLIEEEINDMVIELSEKTSLNHKEPVGEETSSDIIVAYDLSKTFKPDEEKLKAERKEFKQKEEVVEWADLSAAT
ncbi:MAG: hypothetical protein R6U44_11630 [Archaeoglobaceae archaeon]